MLPNTDIYRDPDLLAERIADHIRRTCRGAGAHGAVFGLSGGVDSSALAAVLRIALPRDSILGIVMPCYSIHDDEDDAMLVAHELDIPIARARLDSAYDAIVESISQGIPLTKDAMSNIKPRLRMTALYAAAHARRALVFGSSNKCELTMGYFTKFGDSGVDALPFADLLKGEVVALARYLGVPEKICSKPPSAGLWPGQTDEEEMGITYAALDRYIATGEAEESVKRRVDELYARSAHKRALPSQWDLREEDI